MSDPQKWLATDVSEAAEEQDCGERPSPERRRIQRLSEHWFGVPTSPLDALFTGMLEGFVLALVIGVPAAILLLWWLGV